MSRTLNNALTVCAVLWIIAGTASYCYAFTRDFYAANKHAIESVLDRVL